MALSAAHPASPALGSVCRQGARKAPALMRPASMRCSGHARRAVCAPPDVNASAAAAGSGRHSRRPRCGA
eukprot:328335-Alexandrium_andersonii.AAC.1